MNSTLGHYSQFNYMVFMLMWHLNGISVKVKVNKLKHDLFILRVILFRHCFFCFFWTLEYGYRGHQGRFTLPPHFACAEWWWSRRVCSPHLHMDKALPFGGRAHSSSLNSICCFMLYLFSFYSSFPHNFYCNSKPLR